MASETSGATSAGSTSSALASPQRCTGDGAAAAESAAADSLGVTEGTSPEDNSTGSGSGTEELSAIRCTNAGDRTWPAELSLVPGIEEGVSPGGAMTDVIDVASETSGATSADSPI